MTVKEGIKIQRDKQRKRKNSKRAGIVVLIVMNVLLFVGSVVCMIGTYLNYHKFNSLEEIGEYRKNRDCLILTLKDGRSVSLRFGSKSVRVIDAYRYTDKDSIMEILFFVREHAQENDQTISRSNSDMVGEFRLHTALYAIGYKREQTKDLDWDYTSDPRWYVNTFSEWLGRCGA